MAHGGSPVVVSGGTIINRFLAFLERLSLEIEQDQLEGLKFLLQGKIPLGILENCLTPRKLFTRMMHHSLLREDHLEILEQLFKEIRRSDLAERVSVFKQSSVDMETELPGNYIRERFSGGLCVSRVEACDDDKQSFKLLTRAATLPLCVDSA